MVRDPKWRRVDATFYRSTLLSTDAWKKRADELVAVARQLEPQVEGIWTQLRAWSADPSNVRPPRRDVFGVYFMLVGFAVENLLKGALVAEYRFELEDEYHRTEALPRLLRSHNLVALARRLGLPLTRTEEGLLRRLSRAAVWYGRYPVPVEVDGYSNAETFSDGGEYSVAHFGAKDVDKVRQLISRLLVDLGYEPASPRDSSTMTGQLAPPPALVE